MPLFLIFVAVPIVEIVLFLQVGGAIGTWPTVGIIILTAIIGTIMLRQQGLQTLRSAQTRLAAGDDPGPLLAEGAMILLAGVLLLTPGFFTDAVGFALLMPPVRRALWSFVSQRIKLTGLQTMAAGGSQGRAGQDHTHDQTVDGSYSEVSPGPEPDDDRGNMPLSNRPRQP